MRTDILGVGFDDLTLDEAARAGAALVERGGFHYAVTPNPEFLLEARTNAAFRQTLLDADLVLADGIGVIYSAKILGRPLKGKVTGIDFAQRLLRWMAAQGKRLFLLGAKPGVAERRPLEGRLPGTDRLRHPRRLLYPGRSRGGGHPRLRRRRMLRLPRRA